MSRNNYVRDTDFTGKYPVYVRLGVPQPPHTRSSHRWWVEYRGNRPVLCRPYPGQSDVLDLADNTKIPVDSIPQV